MLALLSVAVSLCVGSVRLSFAEVWSVLTGQVDSGTAYTILRHSRIPRTLGCVLAGCGLAVSGAVIQSVLANPLAAPNIIGVNSGAGLMVALSCTLFPAAATVLPLMAFLGALGGVMLVLFLANRTGAARITLVLAGVAVSSIFSAGIDAVVTFVPEALNAYSDFRIGGMDNLSMEKLLPAGGMILFALAGSLFLCPELDVLMLGEDTARSLGLNVSRMRLVLLTLGAALAGSAVSFCGLLGFVGLIVPHIIRRLLGEESRPLILGCAFGGAALLTVCDVLARTLFSPYVLPVGIVLSLLGGPFFIWLILGQRGGRSA
jgi:iron complex transport system permease protein